jgi:tetratricopeptide (TPR) repeat protein
MFNFIKTPTLCLNMIVKNESSIITRLFDSVISIIDCYCICDTGSTDNTIQIIENYFQEKNIPGKIIKEPFLNFSHNRNFSLKSCIGMSDFVLLLDADMILQIINFDKNMLNNGSCFSILQGNDEFYYHNLRIIQNNGLYNYRGVTHEYIDIPPNTDIITLNKNLLFITDIGDGGSKSNKFERDIKLLLDGIKDEPNNERYHFYLANSYHDSGRFGEAINVYKKRIQLGGWFEEIYYSYYRIGCCYFNNNNFANALENWLCAYEIHPNRLENIYEIIKFYRINGKNKCALLFYNHAKSILDKNNNENNERDTYLFLHNNIYTYLLHFEYSIIASYNGIKNINNEIMEIFKYSNDENINNNLLNNMKFYKYILQKNNLINFDNSFFTNINNDIMNLNSSSSCLIKNGSTYILNIRYVNYYIDDKGFYNNCDKHILTTNKVILFDENFQIIKDDWMELIFDNRRYIGIEDVRIFKDNYNDKLIYIGTGLHKDEKIGIVYGEYNINEKKFIINELKQNFNNSICEKNWVFVDYNNKIHIIYDWFPLKICLLDNNTNFINIVEEKKMPNIFKKIRGSSCGFNYNKKILINNSFNNDYPIKIDIIETEIWFINHIVSYEEPRHYYHIISVFDNSMNLLRYSAPFKFEGEPIEYCLSILIEDEKIFINYSTWDRTTKIAIYDKNYIDSLLIYN